MENQNNCYSESAYHQVVKALKELPSTILKDILVSVARNSPDFFKPLLRQERISTKGFRKDKIFSNNFIVDKVARVIVEERNSDFLKKIIIYFFSECNRKYNDGFLKKVDNGNSTSPEDAFSALEEIKMQWGDEPLFPLYKVALMWAAPEWFEVGDCKSPGITRVEQGTDEEDESVHKEDAMINNINSEFIGESEFGLKNAVEAEMNNLITEIDKHAVKLENWAASLRLVTPLSQDDVSVVVESANQKVACFLGLMQDAYESTGCIPVTFENPLDVMAHVKDLCVALVSGREKKEIISFLESLASALRSLKITHRSIKERKRLLLLRDETVGEVEGFIDCDKLRWSLDKGKTGFEWLASTFAIYDEDLDSTQEQLKTDGYEKLSEFIAFGDRDWLTNELLSAPDDTGVGGDTNNIKLNDSVVCDTQTIEPLERMVDTSVKVSVTSSEDLASSEVEVVEVASEVALPQVVESKLRQEEYTREELNIVEEPKVVTIVDTASECCGRQTQLVGWESKDISDISKLVASISDKVPFEAVAALSNKLAADGEYALAYHLVLKTANLGDWSGMIPAWVYGIAACSGSIQGTDMSSVNILRDFFQQYNEKLFDSLEEVDRVGTQLMLVSGSLESSLFFPITGAASVLRSVKLGKLTAFQKLIDGVAEYGARGVGLPKAALYSTISAEELKQKRESLQSKAREWLLERAPQFAIISRPGREVWKTLISKDGPVGQMLWPIINEKTVRISELREMASKFSNAGVVDNEARNVCRNQLNYRGDIIRPALKMIRRHTNDAVEILGEWINVIDSEPATQQKYDQKILTKLRKCFAENVKEATVELTEFNSGSCPDVVRAGALSCTKVIDNIARLLKGSGYGTGSTEIFRINHVLNDAMLRIPSLPLNADGTPRLRDYSTFVTEDIGEEQLARQVILDIGTIVGEGLPGFYEAGKKRSEIGDHESTSEILRVLEKCGELEHFRRFEHERESSITQHREKSKQRLKIGQRALSDALTKGLLSSIEYECWAIRITSAEHDLKTPAFLRFADIYAVCEQLESELVERKDLEIKKLRDEIKRIEPSAEQLKRLEDVLEAGDVYTATDYLDRIHRQVELPEEHDGVPFMKFFGEGRESASILIEQELRGTNSVRAFLERVRERKQVKGLQLATMQTTQAREAADFLKLWFKTKNERYLSETTGKKIFSFFGMQLVDFSKQAKSVKGSRFIDVWDLSIVALDSRNKCPSACFGSEANGHYKVVGYWRRPAAEDILLHAREIGGGPVVVLYFGRMDTGERRRLVTESERVNVIVIDDILAVFIAGQRKARLLSLFWCTLPFAHLSPYTKAASLLPPEMFYGRRREIGQLMSAGTDSSCLLYGGRQIGKTVLLRHVQQLFEREKLGIATYIDLKGREIGTNRPMDEIWLVIAEDLAKRGVITDVVTRQTKYEWLFKRIDKWLDEDSQRRILVLLDEADAFLAADAKGGNEKSEFSACTVIKDLMERTKRRFKLVFAGLHNVQKSTKVSNNPLAHFGEPICIGAMTDAGESREAEALITEPFASAGYFFESADLPARILAQTNYYPNLIQIYCDELLKYMQQRVKALFVSDETPPYLISAKILEDVYEQHELREELRLRFKWTLELDPRFELIANILVLENVDCTLGHSVSEIKEEAQQWWERGFSSNDGTPLTREAFRDLLEEMVGLGILRRADKADYYALRNPNVLNLIGSKDAVEKLVEGAQFWDPIVEYDPSKFRGLVNETDKELRSPLNAAQEAKLRAEINQVCVVCGCKAGCVDRVDEALGYRFGKDSFVRVLKGHDDLSDFQSELSNLKKRKSDGTTLIVVPDNVRWDRNWILNASKRVSRFRKDGAAVCVLFVAEAKRCLAMISDIRLGKYEGVNFMSVEPWDDSTVNQWLQERGCSAVDADGRKKLAELTGNWPVLLEETLKLLNGRGDIVEELEKVGSKIFLQERKGELNDLFGLSETTLRPLQFLCDNGSGWSPEEISELLDDSGESVGVGYIANVLKWAELCGLVRSGPGGSTLNPGVRQALLVR